MSYALKQTRKFCLHVFKYLWLFLTTRLSATLSLKYKVSKISPKKYLFLSQMTLLRWLTFLHGSQTVILIVLLFWTYFFLLTLVFVLQWLFLLWEILIMLLCQFPLTFQQIYNRIPCFIAYLMTILMLIRMFFVII